MILDKIKYYLNISTDIYFIEGYFLKPIDVEKSISKIELDKIGLSSGVLNSVQESVHNCFLVINEDKSIDFTDDVKQATPVKFMIGALLVKQLNKQAKENNKKLAETVNEKLQFSLVSAADAGFVDYVRNGSKEIKAII